MVKNNSGKIQFQINETTMPEKCFIASCRMRSRALCKCCIEEFCLEHFWQHNNEFISNLKPLKDEIATVNDQYKQVDVQKPIEIVKAKLKQWRIDSYETIDKFVDKKSREFVDHIEKYIQKQIENINQLQNRVDELIESGNGNQYDIDVIRRNLNELKKVVEQVEQITYSVTFSSLKIDDNLIQVPRH